MIGTIVFCTLTQKGPCGMRVNNDIDDDSATKHSDSHRRGDFSAADVRVLPTQFKRSVLMRDISPVGQPQGG